MAAHSAFQQAQIDWNRIQGIVFDLGNVLLDLDNRFYGQGWPADLAPNSTELQQVVAQQNLWYRYETGDIDSLDFLHLLSSSSGLSPKQVTDFWNKILLPGIAPVRYQTLAALQQKFPLLVLSNTNALHIQWVREHVKQAGHPKFETDFFDTVIYSYQVGSVKPEPEIYAALEASTSLAPESLLFIDDKTENISAAYQRGWQGIWLDPQRPVEEVLQPLLERP